MPDLTTEQRSDLIPPCCAECAKAGTVDVVSGSHNGVGVFWVQHGAVSAAVMSGAEALTWLAAKHLNVEPADIEADILPALVTGTSSDIVSSEITGAPV